MAVPFPFPTLGLLPLALLGGLLVLGLVALAVGPTLLTSLRQSGYERAVARELVRLEVILPANVDLDAGATTELIRALHPGQRRGVDRFRVGWPPIELRLLWRDGAMHWQIDCPAQLVSAVEMAVRSVVGRCEIEEVVADDAMPAAVATAKLAAPQHRTLREDAASAISVPHRLAIALVAERNRSIEVALRFRLMPEPARNDDDGMFGPGGFGSFLLSTVLDAVLFRSTSDARPAETRPVEPMTGLRFSVSVSLEAAGMATTAATALLWRLVSATDPLREGAQSIVWRVREGDAAAPSISLGPDVLGALWALPDRAFDALTPRERARPGSGDRLEPLACGVPIADTRHGPLALPTDVLARHLAVFGATGSGKTTLLLNLVLGAAEADLGVTVIDPHGDLTADILGRVPDDLVPRVHVLRLADRQHPRGFNFLERGDADPQLVASEFVALLADLWPRFCGPKMQHYLRHALFAAFADPDEQTILELIRILTNDRARTRYTDQLTDPLERAFWRDEWPGPKERERDPSIKAVLNKLGAFVSYGSIRSIVGQGTSTIAPRRLMDTGDVLVVDLSGVGGDNATLFGAMLISRYAIDAVGRQGTPASERRPHLLVIDEAQRFHTQALESILAEGRKFGLHAALAAQSLSSLGERLVTAVRTNVASIALLQPGSDDVRDLGRLFAPVSAEEILAMRRFDVLLRTSGPDGTPIVRGAAVSLPAGADHGRAAEVAAISDRRDARSREVVEAEVFHRSGGDEPGEQAAAVTEPAGADAPAPAAAPDGAANPKEEARRKGDGL